MQHGTSLARAADGAPGLALPCSSNPPDLEPRRAKAPDLREEENKRGGMDGGGARSCSGRRAQRRGGKSGGEERPWTPRSWTRANISLLFSRPAQLQRR